MSGISRRARSQAQPGSDGQAPTIDGGQSLVAREVSIIYRHRGRSFTAVSEASVAVAAGEFVALVGESGSGKTSLGNALAGHLRPSAGTVLTNGADLWALRGRRRRARRLITQMIFQDAPGSMSPRQTIGASFAELRSRYPDLTSWATPEELMERVGLPASTLQQRASTLSGGQAQRAAIARALLVRPAFIVADEATSALDVSVQAQIVALLRELVQSFGLGVLAISHDLALVRAIADRVYVMKDGHVVESGDPEAVFQTPSTPYVRHLVSTLTGLYERDAYRTAARP